MKTIEEVNKYIARSNLPDAEKRYRMEGGTMIALINKAEADAKKVGLFDAFFNVASIAFKYGMAAGYRMGKKEVAK